MQAPKLSFLFKTTYLPTGAYYYGVYDTTDINFGTHEYKDPYLGCGDKLVDLIKQSNGNRRLFNVTALKISTRSECEQQLTRIKKGLNFSEPLLLNSKEGRGEGFSHSTETKNKMSGAHIGNRNGFGSVVGSKNSDLDIPVGTKLKWFNNNVVEKMILCDANNVPIKDEYKKDWKIGKLHKNSYVHRRLDEIQTTHEEKASQSNE